MGVGADGLVVNVGAGTGSYEPTHCAVLAVEPSSVMVAQRPAGAPPVVRASASALPLRSGGADVALAILTVHHWDDAAAGLAELCRIAPQRLALAIDFDVDADFWLLDEYLPEVADHTRRCGPGSEEIAVAIGATSSVPLLVPRDMEDGVLGAYWCRPEAYLDPGVRANCSGLALADPAVIVRGIGRLEADLANGTWHERHADFDHFDAVGLVPARRRRRMLTTGRPAPSTAAAGRRWASALFVLDAQAVVEATEQPPVLLGGGAAEGPGLDVVGLAERSGDLAEGVAALLVAYLDGPAGGPGEQPVGGADLDAAAGGEHGPLQIGPVQPRQH